MSSGVSWIGLETWVKLWRFRRVRVRKSGYLSLTITTLTIMAIPFSVSWFYDCFGSNKKNVRTLSRSLLKYLFTMFLSDLYQVYKHTWWVLFVVDKLRPPLMPLSHSPVYRDYFSLGCTFKAESWHSNLFLIVIVLLEMSYAGVQRCQDNKKKKQL